MHQVYARWSRLQASAAATPACDVVQRLLIIVSPYTRIAGAALWGYPIAPSFLLEYPPRADPLIGPRQESGATGSASADFPA